MFGIVRNIGSKTALTLKIPVGSHSTHPRDLKRGQALITYNYLKMENKEQPKALPPHPTLKTAADEIQAILIKHNVGGVAILHVPGHVEFTMHVSPNYSLAHMEGQNIAIRTDKSLDMGQRKKKMVDTLNMIGNFQALCAQLLKGFGITMMMLRQKFPEYFPKQDPPAANKNGGRIILPND